MTIVTVASPRICSRRTSAANLVLSLVAAALSACDRPVSHETAIGQWIWSSTDSSLFADAARSIPNLVPTVWIGTIRASGDGNVQSQLALSPRLSGRSTTGVVVRFDDGFSSVWAVQTDSAVANAVGVALADMLAAAQRSGVSVSEVQLDYDCPERLLRRWSAVIALLSRGALAGRSVWITSLISHVRHAEYGDLFRANVAGHILQVFDTGDRMSLPYVRRIERLVSRHRMPFRLGVGAFERRLANGQTTDHHAWFEAPHVMRGSRWFRGVWVFPGNVSWAHQLETAK
jgi:hypothetical protein